MQSLSRLALAAALSVATLSAQAALVNRGNGMIYDTVQNITWLADMNYAVTSGYAAANAGGVGTNLILTNGRMGWGAATAWANDLVYRGLSGWRLPTLNPDDASCTGGVVVGVGFNCTGGELSRLFVADLGYNNNGSGLITSDDTAEQIANLALFSNVQPNLYWSGTDYVPGPGWAFGPGFAWDFGAGSGSQSVSFEDGAYYAVAVRTGDVAASVPAPVPEPQTLALALLALGATMVVRRRRQFDALTPCCFDSS